MAAGTKLLDEFGVKKWSERIINLYVFFFCKIGRKFDHFVTFVTFGDILIPKQVTISFLYNLSFWCKLEVCRIEHIAKLSFVYFVY